MRHLEKYERGSDRSRLTIYIPVEDLGTTDTNVATGYHSTQRFVTSLIAGLGTGRRGRTGELNSMQTTPPPDDPCFAHPLLKSHKFWSFGLPDVAVQNRSAFLVIQA